MKKWFKTIALLFAFTSTTGVGLISCDKQKGSTTEKKTESKDDHDHSHEDGKPHSH